MRHLWIMRLLLLGCILLTVMTDYVIAATDKEATKAATEEDLDELLLRETIEAGRGHRDSVGERDQWSSKEHLRESSKFDTRQGAQLLSPKIRGLLRDYRIECDGCSQDEAVAKINAFVLETKEHAQKQAQKQTWLEYAAKVLITLVVLGAGIFWNQSGSNTNGNGGSSIGIGGGGDPRRLEIEDQRRRAARKLEDAQEAVMLAAKEAPSWVDNEEKEVWSMKQEKQFAKALVSFGGVPPKGRYHLIADKVDGKSRQECLMHHKLQQLIEKQR